MGGGAWRVSRVCLVSSTQDIARGLLPSENSGRVIIAEAQTRGRGRRGRIWHSPPGGLYMTLIVSGIEMVRLVPVMAGVSAAEAVRETYGLEAGLKWPNDIMIGDRKLGGILTEVLWMKGMPRWILIGVGINVNNPIHKALTSATSLSSELGGRVPLREFTQSLMDMMDENLGILRDEPGELLRRWRGLSTTLSRKVMVYDNGKVLHGLAVDISADGGLILKVENELIHIINGTIRYYC